MQALSSSPQLDGLAGSWSVPAAPHQPSPLDAELPFFQGKPIKTSSNLATMASGVTRTGSFSALSGTPVHASLSRENSFSVEALFGSSSTPITPRSGLFDLAPGNAGQAVVDAGPAGLGLSKVRAPPCTDTTVWYSVCCSLCSRYAAADTCSDQFCMVRACMGACSPKSTRGLAT